MNPASLASTNTRGVNLNQASRARDQAESYHLLLELMTSEPFLQECLQIIENTCLCRELDFTVGKGVEPPSPKFKAFINRHWYPFLKAAIKQQHGLGFVVWTVRKLESGDKIPEALPLGTFTWAVEPDKSGRASLKYRIQLGIEEVPFTVTEWVQPSMNVTENSLLHATVQTPLAHLIEEYKILRETQKRHHHADAWNTTARIIVSNDPKEFNHSAQEKEVFETLDFLKDAMESSKRRRACDLTPVDEAFMYRSTNHMEAVYTLPPHHHLENAPALKPTTDLNELHAKFRHNVCSLLGIPCELVAADRASGGQKEARGGRATSRLFQTKMMRVCGFLSSLLSEVYEQIYKEEATFNLLAMPRLEIAGIEDLKILHEIGVLQPEHTVDLSEVLLGKMKKKPKTAMQPQQGAKDKKKGDDNASSVDDKKQSFL
jgi:hypothetical protein